MNNAGAIRIMSRLPDEEFVDREREVAKVCALARTCLETRALDSVNAALLFGAPRVGKTEILRKSFDRLFNEGGEVIPIYYALRRSCLNPDGFAQDYFAQFLSQFVAFRRNDPGLISLANEPLSVIARAGLPEDYPFLRAMVDSFAPASQSGDASRLMRLTLSAPALACGHASLKPLLMIDDWHVLAGTELHTEFLRALAGNGAVGQASAAYVLSSLRRAITGLIPPDEDLFERLEIIRVEQVNEEPLEELIRRRAELLGVEISDSTIELMTEQLNCDVFYTRAILDAAASRGSSLKTFIEFERLYTGEVLGGRIGAYLNSLLHEVAPEPGAGRAVLEALALVVEAGSRVPIDAVAERIAEHTSDGEALLARMHSRELLEASHGFVSASQDSVLSDYVNARYRSEIAGAPRPAAGEELLGEKLKHSYRLMMSRYNRAIQSQLVELLSRFDFQNVPASLFDQAAYDKRYRGMSRVQVRRALDDEQERVRIPQIVVVHDAGAGEQPGVSWRLFAATGFEGGIYTEANEVLWLVALINSKEPLDVETLGRIDQPLEAALRARRARSGLEPQAVRWYIGKEGFSALGSEWLASLHAYRSTFSHLDLIQDYLTRLALGAEARPASEFELVIPIEDEAELIAARTAEQIARAADFDQESINQIKTALIEACINAAEHGDSPDRKIHQRFAIDEDKLIITVSNKGKMFGRANGQSTPSIAAQPAKGARGRGLHIIRALMDEVEFERTDDGTRLVMTKYLKRPRSQ
ncbi:MAG: ATP-binding protein [Acidobacteriota bacterium]